MTCSIPIFPRVVTPGSFFLCVCAISFENNHLGIFACFKTFYEGNFYNCFISTNALYMLHNSQIFSRDRCYKYTHFSDDILRIKHVK